MKRHLLSGADLDRDDALLVLDTAAELAAIVHAHQAQASILGEHDERRRLGQATPNRRSCALGPTRDTTRPRGPGRERWC